MNFCIRALKESDIWVLHKWINDPDLIQFTNTFRPISEMEQKEWFANTAYFRNNYVFGIEIINEQKLIGTCGLYDLDYIAGKAELRIKIGEFSYRGKGAGTETLCYLLSFGFKDLNLHKIWLRVLTDNTPAVKLYKKFGFITDGVLRKDMYIKGQYKNLYIMSLLRKEYDRFEKNSNE